MTQNAEPTAKEPEQKATPETAEQPAAEEQGKTFTQAELDRVIADRLSRERAKMPNADELKAFGEWKKSQQTEAEKAAEREKELSAAKERMTALERENAVIRAGVHADDTDYVIFKVGKMEGDFEKNLKSYLAENKKYTEPATAAVEGTQHGPSKTETQEEKNLKAFRKGAGLE